MATCKSAPKTALLVEVVTSALLQTWLHVATSTTHCWEGTCPASVGLPCLSALGLVLLRCEDMAWLPSGEWRSDPRLEALGQRTVLPAQSKPTSPSGEPETEGIEFKAWRIEHGVAEGDTEMPSG